MAIAIEGAEAKVYGEFVMSLCSSINLMARMEQAKPRSKAPVSPMNIFAGVMLYFRKAINAPPKENATIANSILPIRKNQVPSTEVISNPRLAESPLIPSIRLKEFIMTMMVNMDNKILPNS